MIDRRMPFEHRGGPGAGEHVERRRAQRLTQRSEHRGRHHRVADVIAPHHQHSR